MIATIRKCEKCGYKPVTFEDTTKERNCKRCGGLLKIISTGEEILKKLK